jgi:pimeloyl-ACP methyl ester carboxylesterase
MQPGSIDVKRIQGDGLHIAYETHGEGDPVVLVHGWGGARSIWVRQVSELARRFRVISVDLRGFGDSDRPTGDEHYSFAHCANDLIALLDGLHLERVVFAGHSMGTITCLHTCLLFPERVRALILVGGAVGWPPHGAVVGPQLAQIVDQIQARGLEAYLKAFAHLWFAPATDPGLVRTFTADSYKMAPHAAIAFLRAQWGFNIHDRLSEISVPTLVVVGSQDGRNPVEESEYINRHIPNAWLKVIKGAGHMVHIEKDREFNDAVTAFLLSIPK